MIIAPMREGSINSQQCWPRLAPCDSRGRLWPNVVHGPRGMRVPRKGPVMEKRTKEQAARESSAAKVAAAQEVLAAEVGALVTGADWQQFLDFQAQLHDYSANNVMLIFAQHARAYEEGRVPEPNPTYIAGFESWRALGRSVERGQHGYAVLAPMRSTRRQAQRSRGQHAGVAPREQAHPR